MILATKELKQAIGPVSEQLEATDKCHLYTGVVSSKEELIKAGDVFVYEVEDGKVSSTLIKSYLASNNEELTFLMNNVCTNKFLMNNVCT